MTLLYSHSRQGSPDGNTWTEPMLFPLFNSGSVFSFGKNVIVFKSHYRLYFCNHDEDLKITPSHNATFQRKQLSKDFFFFFFLDDLVTFDFEFCDYTAGEAACPVLL